MKGRRVTRRKKKRPARGSRRGGGIFNIFKRRKPVAASAPVPVVASAPVAVPVAVPYATPLNTPINRVPEPMAVDKPITTYISNKETNKKVDLTNLKQALIRAINAGSIDQVVSVLERLDRQFKPEEYLNLTDIDGMTTPLMLAISKGNTPIVKLLTNKGAKINAEQAKTLREKVAVSKVTAEKAKLIQNTLNFVLESTPIGTPLANQKAPVPAQSAVPVPVPDQRINIHGMPYATPIKPRNGVPVAMAVGKPVITSFATPTANRVPNKKTLSNKNKKN